MPKRKAETASDLSDEDEDISTSRKKVASGDENTVVACEVSVFSSNVLVSVFLK